MYSIFRQDFHNESLKYLNTLEEYLSGSITSSNFHDLRLKKLKEVLSYVANGSEFYKPLIAQNFNEASSLSDLIQQLPFTTKNDLRNARADISSEPVNKAWVYYETTGTTGPSTPCPRNDIDSLVNNSFLTLQYRDIFKRENGNHIVGIMGPTELHSTGDTFEDVFRSLNHTIVKMWPRSPVVGMSRAVTLIKELNITALVCTPAVASEMVKYCEKTGASVKDLGVEVILVLGELITPSRLNNLGTVWGAKIYNCMYASQETSILAACDSSNQLKTIPLNNYYELWDPWLEKVNDVGEEWVSGELVITHLYKGNKPLIRYKTGDMVRAKLSENDQWVIVPIGRVKDVIKIEGKSIYAFDLENIIFESLSSCYEYFVEINRINDKDKLNIILEHSSETTDINRLNALAQKIKNHLMIDVSICCGDIGGLISTGAMVSWKAARINDMRQEELCAEREMALNISAKRQQA